MQAVISVLNKVLIPSKFCPFTYNFFTYTFVLTSKILSFFRFSALAEELIKYLKFIGVVRQLHLWWERLAE